MRSLLYSINVTLDGCVDHRVGVPDAALHRYATETMQSAGAFISGRIIYQMMEEGWRDVAETGRKPDWMEDWMVPFATAMSEIKKYVVSDTLQVADWNAEIVRGDQLEATVQQLKQQPGKDLLVGGVKVPLALAELGLIDDYEFIVQPRIAGHGPTLLAGLTRPLELRPTGRREISPAGVAMRYTAIR